MEQGNFLQLTTVCGRSRGHVISEEHNSDYIMSYSVKLLVIVFKHIMNMITFVCVIVVSWIVLLFYYNYNFLDSFIVFVHGICNFLDSFIIFVHGICSFLDSFIIFVHGICSFLDSFIIFIHGICSFLYSFIIFIHGICSFLDSFYYIHPWNM